MKITASQLRKIINEEVKKATSNVVSEAMAPITPEEISAWKSGDWGFVSGQDVHSGEHSDPNRFLHGEDQHDDEGSMVKSRLHSMKEMAAEVCDVLNPGDQLPGWVQDHISVAHENLQQVHGYLSGKQHSLEHPATDKMEESQDASETLQSLFEGTFDLKEYLKG